MTALGRLQPHIGAELKTTESRHFCRSQGLNCGFRKWGGWGSNPRPADYEKYGRALRVRYLRGYHGVVSLEALMAPFARVARSTNRSTNSMVITGCQLRNVTADSAPCSTEDDPPRQIVAAAVRTGFFLRKFPKCASEGGIGRLPSDWVS
jgi:hypothetical protein